MFRSFHAYFGFSPPALLQSAPIKGLISSGSLACCTHESKILGTRLRLLIWGRRRGLRQQLHNMTTRHAGVVESTDGVCDRVLALFTTLLFSQTRARRERESHPSGRGTLLPRGAGTDPITLIGPQWGGLDPLPAWTSVPGSLHRGWI